MNPPTGEETIFAEALRLPPDERAAYLAQSTHGNAELRRRVESLLGSYEAGDFLEQAAATQSRPPFHIAVPLTEKPGDTIGRYKLLQQIGEGGCGVVYVAEQAEPVRRRVALKIIKLGMDTKSVIARFEAERQAVAMMDHPNIAKVFDAGATQTGRPYFVMELVRGMKITDYCDEAKLSTGGRLDLFIQVCQAIQHAHQKGIIHRDIKPSNILVTVNDGVPVPKVIDFGIAKATSGQQLTDKTIYTAFEQFIGTPAYMSPEQAVLTSLDIDTRSDIYALGVLLYELLTGKTPFDAKELFAIGLDEMRRTIREQEPQRPSTRISTLAQNELSTTAQRRGIEAPKLVSELRGDLDWIVMKALEKDRARRYETANGLAMDIQRHLKNEPVVACPPSRFYRFQKMVRRNKLAFSASGAVLLALVSGLALATWALVRERAAREQVRTEAARSQQVAQFLKDMLQSVAPSVALGRDTTMLREIMDKTAERADKELTNQPAVRAELLSIIGITYFEMGEFSKAEAVLRTALSLRKNVFGDANAFVAASLYNLGNVLEGRKALAESESMHREALAIRRKLFGNEHPDVATSLSGLASSLYIANRKTEAESAIRESLAILHKLFGSEHLEVADALVTLGWIIAGSGRPAEAEPVLREALTMQAKLAGNDHLSLATYFDRLAGALTSQGKLTESEPFQRQAVAMRKKWLGEKHPYVASSLGRLAEILARQGKMAEAESVRGEQSAILAERGDAQTLNQIAWQMATSDDPKLRDGPTAVSFAEKAVAVTNRKDPRTLDTLAAAYAEVGQFASAVIVQREAIALLQDEELKKECSFRLKLFEANSPYRSMDYDAGALAASAMRLLGQGKFAEAEAHARDCLAIREKNMPGHWGTFSARSMLGGSLLGQKKYADAEPLLRSGYEGLKQRQAQIPAPAKPRMREALQYLVQLYEATGEAVQVTEWKQKLAEFDQPTTPKDGGDGLKKK